MGQSSEIGHHPVRPQQAHLSNMIAYLRKVIIAGDNRRERAHVLYTDAGRRFLGDASLGVGSIANLIVQPREILRAGFSLGACGMILAHNHPSGACYPSKADLVATQRLALLGKMVDLELLDHLILTPSAAYSMRAGGTL